MTTQQPDYKAAYEQLLEELTQFRIHYNHLFDVVETNAGLRFTTANLEKERDSLRQRNNNQRDYIRDLRYQVRELGGVPCR